jgi:hypothetical protein
LTKTCREVGYIFAARLSGYIAGCGSPPRVIRLRTPNQTRAAVLKLLLDNKASILEALEAQALASIELICQLIENGQFEEVKKDG